MIYLKQWYLSWRGGGGPHPANVRADDYSQWRSWCPSSTALSKAQWSVSEEMALLRLKLSFSSSVSCCRAWPPSGACCGPAVSPPPAAAVVDQGPRPIQSRWRVCVWSFPLGMCPDLCLLSLKSWRISSLLVLWGQGLGTGCPREDCLSSPGTWWMSGPRDNRWLSPAGYSFPIQLWCGFHV